VDRAGLRELIYQHFNLDELKTICFDLYIKYEDLSEGNLQAKVRELLEFCERNNRLDELVLIASQMRPNVQFDIPVEKEAVASTAKEKTTEKSFVMQPAVSRPTNLSFDTFSINKWPSGWFNSVGFVTDVSDRYQAAVVYRPDNTPGSCVQFWLLESFGGEFGSLMQRCPGQSLAGKVIRIQAEIKAEDVKEWAGIWLRADGEIIPDLVFDNMARRPIRGTTAWKTYTIETSLPQETAWLNYGIVLAGSGTIWADDFRIEVWAEDQTWKPA